MRREEERRRAEIEADERVARENEERFRREEERQDRERAERARAASLATRAGQAQRQPATAGDVFAARSARPAAPGEVVVDSDGFDAA